MRACRAEAAKWHKVGAELGRIGERYGDEAVGTCEFNMRRLAGIKMTEEEAAAMGTPGEWQTVTAWVRIPLCASAAETDFFFR